MFGPTIRQAHLALQTGSVLPSELLHSSLLTAEKLQPALNAATVILRDQVTQYGIKSNERYLSQKPLSMLDGIPIVVKDNFCLAGTATTCGSKMLQNFIPNYNATVVDKTYSSGGLIIAKTNMDEFGMGSGSVDSCFGPVKSIWRSGVSYKLKTKDQNFITEDAEKNFGSKLNLNININTEYDEETEGFIAGGSSGGSAALVAAGVAYAALGSDTGGSVRIPGSWSGLVTLKPSYGHISRHGLIPLVNSLDVPGILARNVEDVAIYYNLLIGHDDYDSTTVNKIIHPVTIDSLSDQSNVNKIKVGIPKEYLCEGMSEEVVQTWSDIADLLENNDIKVGISSLPHTSYSISCYQVLNPCEVASNMARYDGLEYGLRTDNNESTELLYANVRHHGFNDVVRGRILAGNYFLLRKNYDDYFLKALKVRRLIAEDFKNSFKEYDVLLTPATLCEAPSVRDFMSSDNRTQTARHDYCTQPVNLAGLPAATVPVKLSSNSMPLSIQIIGKYGREDQVLSLAKFIEDKVQFPTLLLD